MQAVQATGYIPNALAGGLASRRSKLVAVVVPQINNNMFVDTIQALSDTRRRAATICCCAWRAMTGRPRPSWSLPCFRGALMAWC